MGNKVERYPGKDDLISIGTTSFLKRFVPEKTWAILSQLADGETVSDAFLTSITDLYKEEDVVKGMNQQGYPVPERVKGLKIRFAGLVKKMISF